MKKKTTDAIVLSCLFLVIGMVWAGYFVCQVFNMNEDDKLWMFGFCAIMTTGIAFINILYFWDYLFGKKK
jgi:hypothetical protein